MLVARIDQHAAEAELRNGSFQFFHERRATAGQGAGENGNAVLVFLLYLGAVFVPAAQKRKRFVVVFVFEIMDRVADDAALDAGFLMGFEQVFNRQRRDVSPAPFFGQLRWINMGMPIDDHGVAPCLWPFSYSSRISFFPFGR